MSNLVENLAYVFDLMYIFNEVPNVHLNLYEFTGYCPSQLFSP